VAAPSVLPLPPVYRPEHAAAFAYRPDAQALLVEATAWRRAHALRPSSTDHLHTRLLLVDVQKDFCFPEGTLYVGGRSGSGALEDNRRTAEFIYRNLARLTQVTSTLDTHFPFQIFFTSFWLDAAGSPLAPYRTVTLDDLDAGRARPNPELAAWLADGDAAWLEAQARYYCEQLERSGRYTLYLWPPHCFLGSEGHALVGVLQEARLFHAYARFAEDALEVKGGHPLTEHYSVLRPEVLTRHDGGALAAKNLELLEELLSGDRLIIAGQAASHCVKNTIDDLLEEILRRDPRLARRVFLLTDCMSSVAVPDGRGGFVSDFTAQTEQALQGWADAGMHLVQSTTPIDAWPGD
jgi:nicotinamidase-related amidase